jgi:hypothetical protein
MRRSAVASMREAGRNAKATGVATRKNTTADAGTARTVGARIPRPDH